MVSVRDTHHKKTPTEERNKVQEGGANEQCICLGGTEGVKMRESTVLKWTCEGLPEGCYGGGGSVVPGWDLCPG